MKTKQKTPVKAYLVYLVALLIFVVIYLLFAFPRMNLKLAALRAEYDMLTVQNKLLKQYESDPAQLEIQLQETRSAYDADDTLRQPAAFTNLISDAADSAGVILDGVSVQTDGETPIGGYTGMSHTAIVELSVPDGTAPAAFLSALEQNTGAGFYVKQLSYQPAQDDKELAADGVVYHRLSVTVTCYTLEK
ncbi:MAG: hypothetical protein RSG59_02760 [Ruthenibacterium sp.]